MLLDLIRQHGYGADRPLQAVLFDMDGVLFNSMPNHATSWVEATRRHGLTMTEHDVYLNEGRTGSGTINALALSQWGRKATEEECQTIYQTKSDVFNTLPTPSPMPGAREVLEDLTAQGVLCLIVTGSGQVSLMQRLDKAFPGIFTRERMVTAFDVKRGKPDPEPYLMGLQKAGTSNAVVVENAPLGVRASRASDIFTIAVNTGPLANEILTNAGANLVLPSMQTLATHI